MAARARSVVLPFRMRLLGSILIPPGFGRPNVSTVNPDSVPITSMVFSSGFPSVSMRKSTGMRKVSRGCLILPTTRNPFGVRYTTYSSENSGTPVEVSHRSEEHTSELQSRQYLVCRLLLEKKKLHPM